MLHPSVSTYHFNHVEFFSVFSSHVAGPVPAVNPTCPLCLGLDHFFWESFLDCLFLSSYNTCRLLIFALNKLHNWILLLCLHLWTAGFMKGKDCCFFLKCNLPHYAWSNHVWEMNECICEWLKLEEDNWGSFLHSHGSFNNCGVLTASYLCYSLCTKKHVWHIIGSQ